MGQFGLLAEALRYPAPGRLAILTQNGMVLADEGSKTAYSHFISGISRLSLGDWEELHTRTLDLNPPAAPYIGYQTWGDNYQRGTFMSMMNRAIAVHHVDGEGELPDHLIPVLRLVDALDEPLDELIEVLSPAVGRIHAALEKADPTNPYVNLMQAIAIACSSLVQTASLAVKGK